MNDTIQCGSSAAEKSSNILIKLILLIFVLLVIIIVAVTKMLFAPWQEIKPQIPQPADFILQNRIIGKVMKEFSSKKQLRPEATLKLSIPELNSLLRLIGNMKPEKSPYPLRYYRPQISDNGVFSATFPIRTPAKWLWGGTLYIRSSAEISKTPEDLKCKLKSLHITSFPLPLAQAQQQVDFRLTKLKMDKNYRIFDQAIKSITFDGKRFIIVYRPQQMMMIIMQNR